MIKVTPQGSRSISTGKNINNAASTFVETGPNDVLAGIDAYSGDVAQFKTGAGSAGSGAAKTGGGSSATNGTSGAESSGNEDLRKEGVSTGLDRAKAITKRTSQVATEDLWQALMCGPIDVDKDTTANRQGQMSNASLWLRSTGCSAENLIGLLKAEGGSVGLDRAELERRLSSASQQSLNTMSPEFKESLITELAILSGQDPEAIRVGMAKQETMVSASQSRDANTLSKILSDVEGSNEIIDLFDLHAETVVISGLLDKSIELGIPQATELLLGKIEDSRVRQRVALNRLRSAAVASELRTVRTVIDNSGQAAALAKVPDLVNLITQYYDWGRNVTRDQYADKRDDLVATLNKVDSNWHLKKRDGQWVSNLEPFSVASDDALTLFAMSNYTLQAAMAPKYPKTHYRNVARKYHKRINLYPSVA